MAWTFGVFAETQPRSSLNAWTYGWLGASETAHLSMQADRYNHCINFDSAESQAALANCGLSATLTFNRQLLHTCEEQRLSTGETSWVEESRRISDYEARFCQDQGQENEQYRLHACKRDIASTGANVFQKEEQIRSYLRQCPELRPAGKSNWRESPPFTVRELQQTFCQELKQAYSQHYSSLTGWSLSGNVLHNELKAQYYLGMNMIRLSSLGCVGPQYFEGLTRPNQYRAFPKDFRDSTDKGVDFANDIMKLVFDPGTISMIESPSTGEARLATNWEILQRVSYLTGQGAQDSRRQESIDVGGGESVAAALRAEQVFTSRYPQYRYVYNYRHPADLNFTEQSWQNVSQDNCGN